MMPELCPGALIARTDAIICSGEQPDKDGCLGRSHEDEGQQDVALGVIYLGVGRCAVAFRGIHITHRGSCILDASYCFHVLTPNFLLVFDHEFGQHLRREHPFDNPISGPSGTARSRQLQSPVPLISTEISMRRGTKPPATGWTFKGATTNQPTVAASRPRPSPSSEIVCHGSHGRPDQRRDRVVRTRCRGLRSAALQTAARRWWSSARSVSANIAGRAPPVRGVKWGDR
jgi:hypothetical protein